jgi:hypothetical protein
MKMFLYLSCCVGLLGCAADGDDTFYMTGTEEYAVQNADGEWVCEAPKKVLICHIPPGNPDNAHTICVSQHAVETHQSHHGDLIGACDDGGEDPPEDEDPPQDDPPEDEDPPQDEDPPDDVPDVP